MALRQIGFAACALALSACGQRSEPAAPSPEGGGLEAALNPCAGDVAGFNRTLCETESLAALDGRIRETLVAEAASVSDEGARLIVQNQQRWLAAQRVACGIIDPDAALTTEQTRCLESSLRARADQAGQAVQQIGGYTFQSVEVSDAQAVTAEAAAASGLAEAAPPAIVRNIRYPRIDGAATPQAQRFNALVAQNPQYQLDDQTEEQVTYQIAYAGPELVSVRFDLYELTLGAAHPNTSFKAVTVDMRTGAPLAAETVFQPGSGWERYLTTRAMAALTAQFRDDGFRPPQSDVRDSVTKPSLWLITQDALVLLFPPYTFGGAGALGGAEVRIPWADLRRYLNPRAPSPIRAEA